MVNWHNPVNINLEYFGVVKLVHLLLGIFTWEVLSTLYFDWQFITGKRVFKWPFLLYVGGRFITVFYLVCAAVGLSVTSRIDCQVWFLVIYGSAFLGIALASAFLALRAVAFWNNHKIIIGLTILLWVLNVSFLIYAVTQARGVWDTEINTCIELDTTKNLKNALVTFCTDLVLLAIMLSGIWHRREAGGLWKLVYRQGILWAVGATIGELPCIILTSLDFNDSMNVLFQPLFSVTLEEGWGKYASLTNATRTLCATKMYRELCEYANPVTSTQYQYSSIDISPMKAEASRPSLIIDFPITSIREEFGKQPSNNMKPDISFDYP